MTLRIRHARKNEAALLSELARVSKASWGYPDELLATWADALTVTVGTLIEQWVAVAEEDDAVVGFVAVSGIGAEREIEHLWVRPEAMGRGIGTVLIERAKRFVNADGGSRIRIESDPHAEGFYRRMGAERIGEVPSRPLGRVLPLLQLSAA